MKRKRLDRDKWTTITSKRYSQHQIHDNIFHGIISLLYLDNVIEPSIWKYPDKGVTVCESGMKWLQFIPYNENYALTTMFNDMDAINLWYIDIIADYGFDHDGVAYFDDLYLDLIVRPDGIIKIDDMEELEEALALKDITQALYDMALVAKDSLLNNLLSDLPKLSAMCSHYLIEVEKKCLNRI